MDNSLELCILLFSINCFFSTCTLKAYADIVLKPNVPFSGKLRDIKSSVLLALKDIKVKHDFYKKEYYKLTKKSCYEK